ncbi:hypothetical protein WM2015_767 [Wenzhouxiangella marina]|uniref:Uncharacterized protein n=2 Tax=Wenzhouxiangella marina TaxID=1579979 RepID=A0A0K0XTY9_9GAMM|nr:hypothetical protein WM2015_767 [Wenzhouxiangella marina]
MEILGMIIVVAGGLLLLVAAIWFLVVAFQEHILWGLGCLLLPFVSLVFLVMHWDKAGRPFLYQLAGWAILLLGSFLAGPEL